MSKTVGLISLGCAKNTVDSENLLGYLRALGYEIVSDPAAAQMVFVNTCGFIDDAKQESIDAILEMAAYKGAGLEKLFATGCLAQRYADALMEEIPELDGLMGVADYARLPEFLEAAKTSRPVFTRDGERFFPCDRVLSGAPFSAYVKISDGCDNQCTYCAIPLIRGKYQSRPFDDIIAECERLAAQGVTELTLIAQDTSRYGCDIGDGRALLPELLRRVSEIEGVKWVRVLYCYPDTVDDRLLDEIASNPKVAPYLDLPLQHINKDLLKLMNRRGSPDWIRSRVRACRERGITLRTTMIVGFPGETDAQFDELMDFIEEARFERLGAFAYSQEEGTVAGDMLCQIDDEVKQARLDRLMLAQMEISRAYNLSRVGQEYEVLVEGRDEDGWFGRSILEAPEETDGHITLITDKALTPGEYVRARVTAADAYDLTAEVIA